MKNMRNIWNISRLHLVLSRDGDVDENCDLEWIREGRGLCGYGAQGKSVPGLKIQKLPGRREMEIGLSGPPWTVFVDVAELKTQAFSLSCKLCLNTKGNVANHLKTMADHSA